MNEWGFAAEISKWWEAASKERPGIAVTRTAVEQSTEGHRQRADLTAYAANDDALLVLELRLPDHANPSPFDSQNIQGAAAKAQQLNARWAATSDGRTFVLIDTQANGSILTWLKAPIDLAVPATRAALDVKAKRAAIEHAWVELLEKIDPILTGRAEAVVLAPDEVFVESLRALLARPVAAIRDTVSIRKDNDRQFADSLIRWMVDQQGWSHESAQFEDEVQRVANVSAYVFTTRLLFYEALRRAQPELDRLEIPSTVRAATATVKATFDHARQVSGDYETVFTFDEVCEYALISEEAIDGWVRVVKHLAQFELDAISYDVLGKLFERLIDPQERYQWGQHYTNPDVVDLMLSLATPDGSGVVMDPASGGGTFLVRAYTRKTVLRPHDTHQDRLAEIAGCDQSAFAASIATVSLASRDLSLADNYPRVRASSFFQLKPGQPWIDLPGAPTTGAAGVPVPRPVTLPGVAAVVCNPPYIGYKHIGNHRKEEAATALTANTRTPNSLKGRFNYHLFFWFHAASFLQPDGRLVFITSGEWLDSDYGVQLQQWLLENAHIELVMESLAETWFSEARVGTVVLSARLRPTDVTPDMFHSPTRFVTLRRALRDLYGGSGNETDADRIQQVDALRDRLLALTGTGESDDLDWSVVRQSDLHKLGER